MRPLLLASASPIRLQLLRNAGLEVTAQPARIDEDAIRQGLQADAASPRDIADALAEMKARKLAEKNIDALVLGCDQILAFKGRVFGKPETPDEARSQLSEFRGQTHQLISALVLYDGGKPIWRHMSEAKLTMRPLSDSYLDDYISRNWQSLRESVGGYKLEEEGIRLFFTIEGDYFSILGLPILPLLGYLGTRGFIPT
ncbi:nucleoside triphosphate pyrophosphatase [Cypionkella sp.]|jgi:septum formation protein|uniref:Maf family protein n=1 Tax=Cypionkella sp. TaxID=2811411 RepID=UPI0027188F2E|nr:Maf family nucleotide pyrophosphatase [Cypionkella sp.]MDO8984908.1 Maf family nucleotide pyrophosphatase [Cypionkella sp.]MDP2048992.1 Maf family nucleotide pyrophosphatase [Cypionkella sp.]